MTGEEVERARADLRVSEERLAILERFGSQDVVDLCAEVRALREALSKIRANCNWGSDARP